MWFDQSIVDLSRPELSEKVPDKNGQHAISPDRQWFVDVVPDSVSQAGFEIRLRRRNELKCGANKIS